MNEQRINKSIAIVVGLICAVIATALIALLALMLSTPAKGPDHSERLALLVSIVAPFALVFAAFAWGIFARSAKGGRRMYSSAGWRILAILSAAIGMACATFAGPLAFLVPGVLAIALLLQDEWLQAMLFGGSS